MCLVAFAINACRRWPLVVASNRDEFFDRPTLPMARWSTASGHSIISGRDVRAGGTWLGMTLGGRIAWLTNVRQTSMSPAPRSRGDLVMQWLEGEMDAAGFMAMTDPYAFGGFNLVLGDFQADSWTWLSNRVFDSAADGRNPDRAQIRGWSSCALTSGIYGLSNAALDTPWPKTVSLKASLSSAMATADDAGDITKLKAPLWQALASQQHASTHDLPDTGLPVAFEQALSSAFIDDPDRGYGTRCSTLLVASAAVNGGKDGWNMEVEEKTFLRQPPGTTISADAGHTSLSTHAIHWQRAAFS